ncbi:MAG: ATP-dependent DNA helicase [Clostridiales bacterium]|nr:ATP-dependent DNA helicase [Clostridiales bacterium]
MTTGPLVISVRGLVGFSVFPPDIMPISRSLMTQGMEAHLARQAASEARAETMLVWQQEVQGRAVRVAGRMDLYYDQMDPPLIEEIKLSPQEAPEAPFPEHLLQAVCYGFMLCARDGLPAVDLKVSYANTDGQVSAAFLERWEKARLEAAFFELLLPYLAWQMQLEAHQCRRDESLMALPFPYPDYRPGQREMAAQVYTAIQRRMRLFATMPTGTGKSAAVLYPALKALGQGLTKKVFCLTARGTQRIAMQQEVDRMLAQGLHIHALTLNAKESLCPMAQMRCHPDHCERAKGHYTRQQAALEEALRAPVWDRDFVLHTAERHSLCPFEFSLALCEMADVVICDYNYALDPQVRISRIFEGQRQLTLLVDEAHNLPDRARDMLSGSITISRLKEFRREAGKHLGRSSTLYKALSSFMKALAAASEAMDPEQVVEALDSLLPALAGSFSPGIMHLSRDLISLKSALLRAQQAPEDYALPLDADGTRGGVTALNLNPAPYLGDITKRLSGVVYYSATLSPLKAMRSLLGGDPEDACLELPSPFPEEHLLTLHLPVNTRYAAREHSLKPAAEAILALFEAHPGKMIAYFPSFAYLKAVEAVLREAAPGLPYSVQQPGMDEASRLLFLDVFVRDDAPVLGLCVLGGVFSEGVDLPGKALTSVAILGVGLPQVNELRNLYRARMEEALGEGFAFAYRYPGMHKVLQAAGRLIRSESDRGVLLLMDDRYANRDYLALLPPHITLKRVSSNREITETARGFFHESTERTIEHG